MQIRFGLKSVDINARGMAARLQNDSAFWTFAATEWHRLYSPYVPFESGTLRDSVTIAPKTITHNAPYAHYQYTGEVYGPNYPITQKRRARWVLFNAEPTQAQDWGLSQVQKPQGGGKVGSGGGGHAKAEAGQQLAGVH